MNITATRAAALHQLADFVPRAGRAYADTRNSDLGPEDRANVSQLSPYVRYRLIDEREVVAAVLARHSLGSAEKFVQEVLWRTYWKGWLEMRPTIWRRYCDDLASIDRGSGLMRAVEKAQGGDTGIEGFDDWARELTATGYLHNHARMWFASIWIFTLRLPWQFGADFFARHLLDADPASNTLSWRWVAGLQTAGKTYLATADNIARYTGGRFAPKGLASQATALTEAPIPAPAAVADCAPMPSGKSLLLVTGEDLSPETAINKAKIAGVLAARAADVGPENAWPWGNKAAAFVTNGMSDAATRAIDAFGCDVVTTPILNAEAVITAAQAAGVTSVITAYAPVGPVADALAAIDGPLAKAGISLHRSRRDWDSQFWPHARKGFFAFKEKIPAILSAEGIGK